MADSNDIIQWALGGLAAAMTAVTSHFHLRHSATEIRMDKRLDDLQTKLAATQSNDIRDIWQALDADRQRNAAHRELVIAGLARAATREDIEGLRRDFAAQFQRKKEA